MFIYNSAFYTLIEMKLPVRMCCSLELKPLDQNKREKLLTKILKIGNRDNEKKNMKEVAKELNLLRREGYDVDSYSMLFMGFIQRYGLGN